MSLSNNLYLAALDIITIPYSFNSPPSNLRLLLGPRGIDLTHLPLANGTLSEHR